MNTTTNKTITIIKLKEWKELYKDKLSTSYNFTKPTPATLKQHDEEYGNGNYFDRGTLKFFNQKMSGFTVEYARDENNNPLIIAVGVGYMFSPNDKKYSYGKFSIELMNKITPIYKLIGSVTKDNIKY